MSTDDGLPPRLLDASSEGDEISRRLLTEARLELPPDERMAAWLVAPIKVDSGITQQATPTKHTGSLQTFAKTLGVLVVGAAAVALVVRARHAPAPSSPPHAAPAFPSPPLEAPTVEASMTTEPAVSAPPPRKAADLPPRANNVGAARASASTSAPAPSLQAELARLREARAQLASGDSNAALATIGRYERDFPSGAMRPEAESLAVDALVAAGRTTEARSRAQRFLRVYGGSPQAERMRRFLERSVP